MGQQLLFFRYSVAWLGLLFLDKQKTRLLKKRKKKCLPNPTTKKRRRLKPLAGLPRKPNSRKMLERPQQERRKKCRPKEPLIGKRRQAHLSANDTRLNGYM